MKTVNIWLHYILNGSSNSNRSSNNKLDDVSHMPHQESYINMCNKETNWQDILQNCTVSPIAGGRDVKMSGFPAAPHMWQTQTLCVGGITSKPLGKTNYDDPHISGSGLTEPNSPIRSKEALDRVGLSCWPALLSHRQSASGFGGDDSLQPIWPTSIVRGGESCPESLGHYWHMSHCRSSGLHGGSPGDSRSPLR